MNFLHRISRTSIFIPLVGYAVLAMSLACSFLPINISASESGKIVGWGGVKTPNQPLTNIKKISAGGHSLALKEDGSIVGWGYNDYGQSTPPSGNDFITIAAGQRHSLALKADGSIVAWGRDTSGQATPPEGNDFIAIAAGGSHNLALKADGSIAGWGWDNSGQATPPEGNDFIAIAAGGSHNLALKADGSIVAWGYNDNGQATPPSGNDFIAIAAGSSHSLALKQDGSIVGWGYDWYGQATPPEGNDFVAIAAGLRHSLALKEDGSIVGWGYNDNGQATPLEGNDFIAIAAGGSHSLSLKQDGSIVGWGYNDDGQATPPSGNEFVAIAAGNDHSLALKEDGSIVGWGYNGHGQATPPEGNDFIAIAAGGWHSLALKEDGSIVGWGYNNDGQATPPSGNDFVAIAAGCDHSLALKADGSIVGWGDDHFGQATPPSGNDFVAIAAGCQHSLAIKTYGETPSLQAPTPLGPGTETASGRVIGSLSPTMEWIGVHGADSYYLAISKYPYGSTNIIYSRGNISDTSVKIPGGYLQPESKYRWNMRARAGSDFSPFSSTLYFQTEPSDLLLGIDVSHHQGKIDWAMVNGSGKKFAFIKATEGTNFMDEYFETNVQNALDNNMLIGAHHFARPLLNPGEEGARAEARYFWYEAAPYIGAGYLPPVLDIEDEPFGEDPYDQCVTGSHIYEGQVYYYIDLTCKLEKSGLSEWIRAWIDEFVELSGGVEPILYMNRNYAVNGIEDDLSKYPLWLATHDKDPFNTLGDLGPWDSWLFKQYDDKGQVPGISNNTDLNSFNGNFAKLQALTNIQGQSGVRYSGRVFSAYFEPIASATVKFKQFNEVIWQGATDDYGYFTTSDLNAEQYTVVASKTGFVTDGKNTDGRGGGINDITIILEPLLPPSLAIATNRIPADTAVRQQPYVSPTDPNSPRLKFFVNGNFVDSASSIDTGRPTVIMTHGWNSNPDIWASQLAHYISMYHGLNETPNIISWDWRYQADAKLPPIDAASELGVELGKTLQQVLGNDYARHIHLIGHSLGTIVNAYACNYAHGSLEWENDNPQVAWSPALTTPHVTLLDEAEVASPVALLEKARRLLQATTSAAMFRTSSFRDEILKQDNWKDPIPEDAVWVDNYISAFGFYHSEAVNVSLLSPLVTLSTTSTSELWQDVKDAHGYSYHFYMDSMNSDTPPAIGFDLSAESGAAFPPTGAGTSPGARWFENLDTTEYLYDVSQTRPDLGGIVDDSFTGSFPAIYALAPASIPATAGSTINWVKYTGGNIIYKSGKVLTGVGQKLKVGWQTIDGNIQDALDAIDPSAQFTTGLVVPVSRITLITPETQQGFAQGAAQAGTASPGDYSASSPAAWFFIRIPENAEFLVFDFTVTGDPGDDRIACAINQQNVFTIPASFAAEDELESTDLIDISEYSGQEVEMFFGFVGGTSAGCEVTIDGIRFISPPSPNLSITADNENCYLQWPATATGWTLQKSRSLGSNTWTDIPLESDTTIQNGAFTVPQPIENNRTFFRLKKQE